MLNVRGLIKLTLNILWIKPLYIKKKWIKSLNSSRYGGIVIDDDYQEGVAKSIANDLNLKTGKKIFTMGLKNKSAGFHKKVDNSKGTGGTPYMEWLSKLVDETEKFFIGYQYIFLWI